MRYDVRECPAGRSLSRIARLTGLLAALCVVGTTATVLVVRPGRPPDLAPPESGRVGETAVVGVVRFRVPEHAGWSRSDDSAVAGFRSADGGADPVVFGPAYFRRGWCPQQPRWSSRALMGRAAPVRSDDPRRVNAVVSGAWIAALGVGARRARVTHRQQARAGAGWRTSAVVDLSGSRQPCTPPRVRLEALSVELHGPVATVATFVLVADRGVPGELGRHAIMRIMSSVGGGQSEPVDP